MCSSAVVEVGASICRALSSGLSVRSRLLLSVTSCIFEASASSSAEFGAFSEDGAEALDVESSFCSVSREAFVCLLDASSAFVSASFLVAGLVETASLMAECLLPPSPLTIGGGSCSAAGP